MKQMKKLLFALSILTAVLSHAQAPSWSVNPNAFQYNMTITAVLDVNCTELTNPTNQLGAFQNGVLRGTGRTLNSAGGRFLTTMSIYSNVASGENITFRFYDATADSIYTSIDSVVFQDNAIYGTPGLPEVLKTNNAPTQITLSNDSILENQASGQIVGMLQSTDQNVSQTHSYSLVSGAGSTNNSLFSISGNQLLANFTADFETRTSYDVRIQTTDSEGCTFEDAFAIQVKNVNDAPTSISLSATQIDENNLLNVNVAMLSATDTDANEQFTFSLVSGLGGADNVAFSISGNNLRASTSFDFETQDEYAIRVQVSDRASNTFVDTFKISINNLNEAPSDILLTSDSIRENQAVNSLVATLSTVDQDAGQSFSYSFSNVPGNDNANFNLVGNTLRGAVPFDFETRDVYFIYIQTNDLNGGLFTKQLTIRVTDINDAPSDVDLSTNSVNENMPIGSFAAQLLSTDQDVNSTFTYALVNGVGASDNSDFLVRNDSLFTRTVLDLNAQATHNIRLETNDGLGGVFSKAFTIIVKDINNIPTNLTLSTNVISENVAQGAEVGVFTTTDADGGDIHSYSLVAGVGDSNNTAFSISSNKLLTNTTFSVNRQSRYSVRVQTDDGFGGVFQKVFTINITNSNDNPTDIQISNDSIFESLPPNTAIGLFTSTDPDSADTHSYSFASGTNDNALFAIVGNQLRSAVTFNFEVKSSYFISVQSADGNRGTFVKQFNISVKDTTDGPTDISLNNNLVAENSATRTLLGEFTSTDEDANDSFTYSLVSGINSTDNAAFQISNDSLFTVSTFNYEARQNYNIRVRSTDASGLFTSKSFAIKITDANDAPTNINLSNANIGEDASLNTTVGIFTTLDPDTGNTHTYTLVAGTGDGDNSNFDIVGNTLKTDTVFDVNIRTAYTVRVRTTDGTGATFEKAFALTITNANDAPTDISLTPANINENLPANSLVGMFASVDADAGDSHIYTFANLSANDNANFAIVGTELRTAGSFDFETKSIYFIQIQSSDGNGGTYSRQLFVNVNDTNDTPTDLVLSANSIQEKQVAGVFLGRLSSVDQDAVDNYNYTLTSGTGDTDNSGFVISNDSVFSNTTFDVLVKNLLSIRIRTSDQDNKQFEKVFSIFVQNVNDAPTDITLSNASVPENTAVNSAIGNFTTSDIDPMQTFNYQLVAGTGDADNSNFTISGNELRSNILFDFNTQKQHNVRIRSTDQGGLSTEKAFTVNITNSNDAPTNITLSPNNFKENLPQSSLIGEFSTVDKDSTDLFSYSFVNQGTNDNAAFIISGRELRTSRSFDFETKNLYIIQIQTTDNVGATYNRQLTVNVTDSNDAPTALTISADSLFEKSPKGTFVANLTTADEDANDSFTYNFVAGQGATDNGLFRINGSLLESDSTLDFNNGRIRSVRVQSTDQGGRVIESSFLIRVINQNDLPSAILISDTVVNEVAPIGTRVGVIATIDEDATDTFVYDLVAGTGDSGNGNFTIDGNELKSNALFDFETQQSFSIRVRTTDSQGGTFEQTFTIAVTNGNELPIVETQLFSIPENTAPNTILGSVFASDLDVNETFTFSTIGNLLNFKIDPLTGELSSIRTFDYEAQTNYEVTVEVTDAGGLKDTATMLVEILDQVEGTLPAAGYFSPNGDGRNDEWRIQNVELYSNFSLKIFSANGGLVYEKAANYTNDWDGTTNGSELPEGIYYYFLEDTTNPAQNFKGVITLKR